MRLNSLYTLGALFSAVYAAPKVDRRGTYETGVDVYSPSPSMGASTTHDVYVGGTAGLVYSPQYIMANVGDIVTFHFGTKNHTVTQSTFAMPCGAMDGGA